MPPATLLPYDRATPARPSLDDLGGAQKQQDPANRPDPVTDLTADDVNTWALLLQRFGVMVPLARVRVHLSDAGARVVSVVGLPTGAQAPVLGSLASAFRATRVGPGDVDVTWLSGTLPQVISAHVSTPYNNRVSPGVRAAQCDLTATGVAVQVFVPNTGAFVDSDFVLTLY